MSNRHIGAALWSRSRRPACDTLPGAVVQLPRTRGPGSARAGHEPQAAIRKSVPVWWSPRWCALLVRTALVCGPGEDYRQVAVESRAAFGRHCL